MKLANISQEFHRTVYLFDTTPPFDFYKKITYLWRATTYLFVVVKNMEKIKEHPAFKNSARILESAIDELKEIYVDDKILDAYMRYHIFTNMKDKVAAKVLLDKSKRLNEIRDVILTISVAAGLDKFQLAIEED